MVDAGLQPHLTSDWLDSGLDGAGVDVQYVYWRAGGIC